MTSKRHGVSFHGDENALKLTVVMATQLCEYRDTLLYAVSKILFVFF